MNCKDCKFNDRYNETCKHIKARVDSTHQLRTVDMRLSALCDREAKLFQPSLIYQLKQILCD